MLPNVSGNPELAFWWCVQSLDGTHYSTHMHEVEAREMRDQVSRELQRPFRVVKKVLP